LTRPAAHTAQPLESDDLLNAIPVPLIRETASAICAAFRNEFGDAVDQAELRAVAGDVGHLVAGALADEQDTAPRHPATRSALGRYVLDRIAERVYGRLGVEPADHAPALAWGLAFAAVRRVLQPDWSEFFNARLSGPGCHDLVVEVAHDLRSPLTSILFLAETLHRGQSGPVSEIQRRQLGLIYSAALGLSAVTSDIIELARGGDRLVGTERAPFSVSEIFESVRDIVQPIAEEKGLEIRIAPPESDHRLGHPLALSRVLLNLTTNALKFTDEGYVELVAMPGDLDALEFSVGDTGHGISHEALETLYQPFRRVASREGGYCFSGTGLGLAICRRLVEAMGGTLEVKTAPGKGTRFGFLLDLPRATDL
jgi:two-component sensor histidine kinase